MSDIKYGHFPIHSPNKIYLIGDVHNEANKLADLLEQIEPLIESEDHVVFCGDLVDRGSEAARTIEILVDFTKRHPDQVFFVRGNHDWMLKNYLSTGNKGWFDYLSITLENYKTVWNLPNIEPQTITLELINRGFKEITSRTVPYYETEHLIATHAPLDRKSVLLHGGEHYQQDFKDKDNNLSFRYLLDRMDYEILWQFVDESDEIPWIDKFRVCGHQPAHHKKPRIFKDRAFIDSGCGKGDRPLTCLVYPSKKYFQSRVKNDAK